MNNSISQFKQYLSHNKPHIITLDRLVKNYAKTNTLKVEDIEILWQKLEQFPVPALVIYRVELFYNRVLFFDEKEVKNYFCQQYEAYLLAKQYDLPQAIFDFAQKQLRHFNQM
jgi:hypothetical protein